MAKMKQDFWVGIVFFAGIVLVGIFTIVVKDISWLKGHRERMTVVFKQVAGLEKGHKVLASGMEVGQVNDLELLEDGAVRVDINLTRKIKLHKDYKITVKDTSALGGKYVDIEIGSPEEEVILMSHEEKLRPLDGKSQSSLFDDPNLRDIFVSVRKIAKDLEEGKGTLGLLITQRDIYDNISAAAKNLKDITDQMKSNEGTIGKLLYDRDLYDKIGRIATNVEEITDKVSKGQGTLGKLVMEDTVYQNLKKTFENAERMTQNLTDITDRVKRGEGTVGKLFMDDKVYDTLEKALVDARTMMKGINEAVGEINSGRGTLGKLLKDETMGNDLKETIANVKVVSERLKKGEGTVGKLLTDDELYKEIRRLVKTFSDSIEDTREQVPISTFSSLLFKAF